MHLRNTMYTRKYRKGKTIINDEAQDINIFTFPDIINPCILDNTTMVNQNLYKHSCGNWVGKTNRIFHKVNKQNNKNIKRVNSMIIDYKNIEENYNIVSRLENMHLFYESCKYHYTDKKSSKERSEVNENIQQYETIINESDNVWEIVSFLFNKGLISPLTFKIIEYGPEHLNIRMITSCEQINLDVDIKKMNEYGYKMNEEELDAIKRMHTSFCEYTNKKWGRTLKIEENNFFFKEYLKRIDKFDTLSFQKTHENNRNKRRKIIFETMNKENAEHVIKKLLSIKTKKELSSFKSLIKFYLRYSVYRFSHIRPQINKRNSITSFCIKMTQLFFPVEYCRAFAQISSKNNKFIKRKVKIMASELKNMFVEYINNRCDDKGIIYCKHSNSLKKQLIESFNTLKIDVGFCGSNKETNKIFNSETSKTRMSACKKKPFTGTETLRMNAFDYLSNLLFVFKNDFFAYHLIVTQDLISSLTRDILGQNNDPILRSQYVSVNSWYDPHNHRVVIPIGLLQYPLVSVAYNMRSFISTIGFIISHELVHSTEHVVFGFDSSNVFLLDQLKTLFDAYKSHSVDHDEYLSKSFLEFRADWIGLYFSYNYWKKKYIEINKKAPSDKDSEDYFVSYSQLWCSGKMDFNFYKKCFYDEHPTPFDRSNVPYTILKNISS